MSQTQEERALNRVLLREAGEHLGTLAEQERERYLLGVERGHKRQIIWNRYIHLAQLSRDVLEIANG